MPTKLTTLLATEFMSKAARLCMHLLPHASIVRLFLCFRGSEQMKTVKWLLASSALLANPAMAEILDLEKDELTFGFIKLTDMAPLLFALPLCLLGIN